MVVEHLLGQRTPLEARDGSGQLNTACKTVGKRGEGLEQKQAHGGGSSKKGCLLLELQSHGGHRATGWLVCWLLLMDMMVMRECPEHPHPHTRRGPH